MTITTMMILATTQRDEVALRPAHTAVFYCCLPANGGEMMQQPTCKRIRRTTLGPEGERTMAGG
jgi:hypothetical protein